MSNPLEAPRSTIDTKVFDPKSHQAEPGHPAAIDPIPPSDSGGPSALVPGSSSLDDFKRHGDIDWENLPSGGEAGTPPAKVKPDVDLPRSQKRRTPESKQPRDRAEQEKPETSDDTPEVAPEKPEAAQGDLADSETPRSESKESRPAENDSPPRQSERSSAEGPESANPQPNNESSYFDQVEKGITGFFGDAKKDSASLKKSLEEYADGGGNWMLAALGTTALDIADVTMNVAEGFPLGILDIRNLGEGVAKGTWEGGKEDLSILANFVPGGGKLAKIVYAAGIGMAASDIYNNLTQPGTTNLNIGQSSTNLLFAGARGKRSKTKGRGNGKRQREKILYDPATQRSSGMGVGRAPRLPRNYLKAILHKNNTVTYIKIVEGKRVRVTYDSNGFPDFSRYRYRGKHGTASVDISLTGDRKKDFRAADAEAGFTRKNPRPNKFTWHHNSATGKMDLVSTAIHNEFPHDGLFSFDKNIQRDYDTY